MKSELTKQDILELQDRQAKEFHQRLLESEKSLEKRLGELAGTWGKFVAEMVKPKIIELFKARGISIQTTLQNV